MVNLKKTSLPIHRDIPATLKRWQAELSSVLIQARSLFDGHDEEIADLQTVKVAIPSWQQWTPTFSANFTSTTLHLVQYLHFADVKLAYITLVVSGTTASSLNEISASLPVTRVTLGENPTIACSIAEGGSATNRAGWGYVSPNIVHVRRFDNAVFGNGAARFIRASGWYRTV